MNTVKDIFKISKGKKAVESSEITNYRYIQIEDLRTNNELKYAVYDQNNVICDENDVLIAWDGANAGTIGYGLKGVIGSTIAKLTPIIQGINSCYAGRFLQSKFQYLRENCTGATIPHISRPVLEGLKLPLPPLEEQKKIAAILDAADALRQKDKVLIAKYEELTQSLFLDMFGDPVRNPKGWEKVRLEKLCSKITDGTHQSPKFLNEGIPFLFVSNIVSNKIDFCTKKFISEEEYNFLTKNTPIEVGDILYTSVGSYGNPAIVLEERKFAFQRHIAHLKPKSELINVDFFHSMLLSPYVKRQADKYAKGVAQKTLNLKEIKNMMGFLPPLSLQFEFAKRARHIVQQKYLAQQSFQKSEELFNSLLQRAFKGELTKTLEVV